MRLTVEIKDNQFIYSWEVGESRASGTSKLSADLLCKFTTLLSHCASHEKWADEQWRRHTLLEAVKREEAGPATAGKDGENG